jgi:hypothetical protein
MGELTGHVSHAQWRRGVHLKEEQRPDLKPLDVPARPEPAVCDTPSKEQQTQPMPCEWPEPMH